MESQIMFKIGLTDKKLIETAAELIGLKTGSFVRSVSLEKAREIIIKNKVELDLNDLQEISQNNSFDITS